MKRIIKGLLISIVVGLSLLINCTTNVYASTKQTAYININDNIENLTIDNLVFSNIKFNDYSATSTQAFGLSGIVTNKFDEDISYTSLAYYYDSNYNLIAKSYNSKIAVTGNNNFSQMSNLNILNGHNINKIAYYRLIINITDNTSNKTSSTSTTPSELSKYNYSDYVIDKYDVNMVVNENNTFDITETITAYFNAEKHGIFRNIPLRNKIIRSDGTISKNRAQVTNLSVNEEYTQSKEDEYYNIKIGSSSKTVTGKHTYIIKYTYNIGKDSMKNYDELYYNIIGNEWDTAIGNISFTVTMPKKFDSNKLGFSSGTTGSIDNSKVNYNVEGNVISGSYDGILESGEALTIRCELDEGYFVGAGLSINFMNYIAFLFPVIFLGLAVFILYKYGRDEKVVETVEFYPPEGFNSLEVGFLYKGKAVSKDVTSLLIYLANKGYIKITETEEKSLFAIHKGFKITKLKEYDGNNINEQLFLTGLFECNLNNFNNFSSKDENIVKEDNLIEVTSLNLHNKFYDTMIKILSNINNKENKHKIFENSKNQSIFIILMIIATCLFITIPPIMNYGGSEYFIITLAFSVCVFILILLLLFSNIGIFMLLFVAFLEEVLLFYYMFPLLSQDLMFFIGYILGLICIVGMFLCLKFLPKRTKYGTEILGKIKGFKNFLETAEKEKLEAMVEQNPTYFYDILPYTYVLGVSDTWIKKFETISLQAPTWYDSPNAFDMVAFGSFINSTMIVAENVFVSNPSDAAAVGSSGGGFSGGGSGGGGGGSW